MKKQPEKFSPGSAQHWLSHAQSDLNLARVAKERDDILPEQACFHAQQAAEKALKAVLVLRRIEFPYVHDLEALTRLAQDAGINIPPEMRSAKTLNPYAVEIRYPGWIELTPSEVDEAIHLANCVVIWASKIVQTA